MLIGSSMLLLKECHITDTEKNLLWTSLRQFDHTCLLDSTWCILVDTSHYRLATPPHDLLSDLNEKEKNKKPQTVVCKTSRHILTGVSK